MPLDPNVLAAIVGTLFNPGAGGAGFGQGALRSMQAIDDQEREAAQQAEARAFRQFQIENTIRDNQRADAAQAYQEDQRARQAIDNLTQFSQQRAPELAETATDPLQAQNQLVADTAMRGLATGTPAVPMPLPNMTALVSNRDKKRAQDVLDRLDKDPAYAGHRGTPELEEITVTFNGQPKKVRELRAMTALGGVPPKPATKTGSGRNLQSKEVLRGGKRAMVNFEPDTGKYFDLNDQPVTDISPIPPVSAMQTGGANPQQVALFNRIAGEYERSPLVRAADRTIILDDAIKTIEKTPTDPSAQLRLAYSYIQALDTYQSAVREGELGNLGMLGTKLQQWQTKLNKVAFEGAFLPAKVAKNIARDARQLVTTIETAKSRKQQDFANRANVSGVGEMWNQFTAGGGSAKPATIRARDPQGKLHEAPAGTALPAGWVLEK